MAVSKSFRTIAATGAMILAGAMLTQAADQVFPFDNPPDTWQEGQQGTNNCKKWLPSSQDSQCQTLVVNSASDFCLYAPPEPGPNSDIGSTERIEVAWCTKPGYGTRLMPAGTLKSAHFVKTKTFVQVTGMGDLTKLNIPKGDEGGELDNHGADGNGNPIGGLVYTTAFGLNGTQPKQVPEWHNFMAADEYCIRACVGGSPEENAAMCQHIYDTMGCEWVDPGNYSDGFDNCESSDPEPPGVYGTSTFYQGDAATPAAHAAPPVSKCTTVPDPLSGNGNGSSSTSTTTSTSNATSTGSQSSSGTGPAGIPVVPAGHAANGTTTTPGQTPGTTTSSTKGANSASFAAPASLKVTVALATVAIGALWTL